MNESDSRPFDRPGDPTKRNNVVPFSDTPALDDALPYFATFDCHIPTNSNVVEVQDMAKKPYQDRDIPYIEEQLERNLDNTSHTWG